MYLISYDIEKDRLRNKIAKELENMGKRVQYSVFECDISKKQYDELYGKLAKLLGTENGSIRFYSLCVNCEAKLSVLGTENSLFIRPADDDLYII